MNIKRSLRDPRAIRYFFLAQNTWWCLGIRRLLPPHLSPINAVIILGSLQPPRENFSPVRSWRRIRFRGKFIFHGSHPADGKHVVVHRDMFAQSSRGRVLSTANLSSSSPFYFLFFCYHTRRRRTAFFGLTSTEIFLFSEFFKFFVSFRLFILFGIPLFRILFFMMKNDTKF